MNKKGFTLVELLVVVILIAAIVLLALPKITDSVKNNTDNVDKIAFNIIKEATKLYVSDNSNLFHKKGNKIYCIKLNELVDNKYLKTPILYNGLDVTNTKVMRVTYDNGFNYELVNKKDCKILPSEYQEVEYIESTGTQWIDTGVIPDAYTGFSIDASFTDTVTDTYRFGCRNDNNSDSRFVLGTNNTFYFGYGGLINDVVNWRIQPNVFYNMQLNFLNSRQAGGNGFAYMPITDEPLPTMKYSIIMFGRNVAGSISSSPQTIKTCKISQGDEIIRDFVPCYHKSDGVIGMYDLVHDVFYTNKGTGNFLKGQDI